MQDAKALWCFECGNDLENVLEVPKIGLVKNFDNVLSREKAVGVLMDRPVV